MHMHMRTASDVRFWFSNTVREPFVVRVLFCSVRFCGAGRAPRSRTRMFANSSFVFCSVPTSFTPLPSARAPVTVPAFSLHVLLIAAWAYTRPVQKPAPLACVLRNDDLSFSDSACRLYSIGMNCGRWSSRLSLREEGDASDDSRRDGARAHIASARRRTTRQAWPSLRCCRRCGSKSTRCPPKSAPRSRRRTPRSRRQSVRR